MRKRQSQLVPLREILPKTLQKIEEPPDDPLSRLRRVWPEIVGPLLASKSDPLRIRGGRLLVGVTSPVWANEMDFLKLSIFEKVARELPELNLDEIRFQIVTSLRGSS